MFCDACGSPLPAGQKFCGGCGKQVGVAPGAPVGVGDGRVAQNLAIVAWLWIAMAVFTLPVAIVLIVLGTVPLERFLPGVSMPDGAPGILAWLHAGFLALGILCLLLVAVHIFAAWGLFHHAPWARILTIAFAFLRILEFPFGTALAIYTIWVLLGQNSEKEYRSLAHT
jgi:hypothetical protein